MKTEYLIAGIAIGAVIGIAIGALLFKLANPPATASIPARTYNNEERWKIIRDPSTGRTTGITVHRKAEEN